MFVHSIMIQITYIILLLFMLFVLYKTGLHLQKKWKIISAAGLSSLLVYTLNEGLRFGRGIDYNLYWRGYMNLEHGWDTQTNIGFYILEKTLVLFNLPWQACVIIMSFIFILATLILMKNYRQVIMFALPLWVFFTKESVENLMRWNLAFSFIMIGLSFLLQEDKIINYKFWILSLIGATFHYAILPIPIVFNLLYFFNKPIIKPVYALVIFLVISLLFEVKFMMHFANMLNNLSFMGDKFQGYIDNAEFWLTKSVGGVRSSSWIGGYQTFLSFFLAIAGYICCKKMDKKYIFAYNLFIIGLILRPLTIQVELLNRFDNLFFYFRAIVFATIIYVVLKKYVFEHRGVISVLLYIVLILTLIVPIKNTLSTNENKLLYIWNSEGKTPESMLNMYYEDKQKK